MHMCRVYLSAICTWFLILFVLRILETALVLPQSCQTVKGRRNGSDPIETQFEVGESCQPSPPLVHVDNLVLLQVQDPQLLKICHNFGQLFDAIHRKVDTTQS